MEYTFDFSTGVSPYPVWLCSMDIGTALDRVSVSAREGSCRGGRRRIEGPLPGGDGGELQGGQKADSRGKGREGRGTWVT